MQTFTTPMMKQYLEIKKQYMDCLLFYRMGDFYELFLDDALIGSEVMNITLTSRPKGKDGRIPMAGVPFHAVDIYIAKLVKAGHKVAICEQMTLPNKKGIIKREVIRTVTPGTMLDEKTLEKKENNYIISLSITESVLAISIADISTGYFAVKELPFDTLATTLQNELAGIRPSECILSTALYNNTSLLEILHRQPNMNIYCFQEWEQWSRSAKQILQQHFQVTTLEGFGIEDQIMGQQAAAALIGYLQQTQKSQIGHIKKIQQIVSDTSLQLDRSTILNLELFSTIREQNSKGSVLSVIDQTMTPMGGRMLKNWLRVPLYDKEKIIERHDSVEILLEQQSLRSQLREKLRTLADIERILSRLTVKIGNARDIVNLKNSLQTILEIKEQLTDTPRHSGDPSADQGSRIKGRSWTNPDDTKKQILLQKLQATLTNELQEIINYIKKNIQPEPPIDLRSGGMIKKNVDAELDRLHAIIDTSKIWMTEFEQTERERSGIGSLKVRFNSVFGFYIEVSKSHLSTIPDNYQRKQTLVNGERFITPELKVQENIVLAAEEKMQELEYQLFWKVLEHILSFTEIIQSAAESIATLDSLLSLAEVAEKRHYVRAEFSDEKLMIKEGRHPVVETLLIDQRFVPNDTWLENDKQSLLLITGPNMAGKSVYIRQVALIVLLNQIGSFVPASEAKLPLVDRVFVRSGASDVITEGLSTFMVEMVETAYILHHATEKSLIIMDEIGRGTSTYDGISIAWAVADYLATKFVSTPKTLFATHYHELQKLEEEHPHSIKNYHMSIESKNSQPIFLHTLLPGGASHSFGIAVARLAGVPEEVEEKAKQMLDNLERRSGNSSSFWEARTSPESVQQFDPGQARMTELLPEGLINHLIHKELQELDILQMTPLSALNKLAELKEQLKIFQKENEQEFLKKD